eukprot:jgi/Chlat1/3085/Chrsp21S03325
MASKSASKKLLEVFKFGVYLAIPVSLTAFFVASPSNLESVIENRRYVVYPPEGPRPPSADELDAMLRDRKRALEAAAAKQH